MGVIYRAHDPAIDRDVAIKVVRADLTQGEDREVFVARFRREAQAAGRCVHPNIVTIHDFGMHDGNPFLAMELVEGESLSVLLRRDFRLAPGRAVSIMHQVLAALAAAHAQGIVHRDVKPANILLLPDGRVKVTDFGIARLEGPEAAGMTRAGSVIGTPSYMSPEQCRGEPVDARSDLFSAGAVLFEMLSGERPFGGGSLTAIALRVVDARPLDVAARLPDMPASLVAAVARALAKAPDQRFASAEAMAAALAVPASPGDDTTVIARGRPLPEDPALDPATLATIERELAQQVGPIAHYLVREAARGVASAEMLRDRLGLVTHAAVRRPAPSVGTEAGLCPPPVQERVRQDLTRILGPVASLLVRRAAGQAGSEAELRRLLAVHIENEAERAAFEAPR